MELQIAKADIKDKKSPAKITLDEVKKQYGEGKHIFYFDGSNPHKDMQKAKTTLEKANLRVKLNEVRYGLDANNYIYEIHII